MATKDFITYSPNTGNKKQTISVTASKNTGKNRSTVLNISAKGITKSININQKLGLSLLVVGVSIDEVYYPFDKINSNSASVNIEMYSIPYNFSLNFTCTDMTIPSYYSANSNSGNVHVNKDQIFKQKDGQGNIVICFALFEYNNVFEVKKDSIYVDVYDSSNTKLFSFDIILNIGN